MGEQPDKRRQALAAGTKGDAEEGDAKQEGDGKKGQKGPKGFTTETPKEVASMVLDDSLLKEGGKDAGGEAGKGIKAGLRGQKGQKGVLRRRRRRRLLGQLAEQQWDSDEDDEGEAFAGDGGEEDTVNQRPARTGLRGDVTSGRVGEGRHRAKRNSDLTATPAHLQMAEEEGARLQHWLRILRTEVPFHDPLRPPPGGRGHGSVFVAGDDLALLVAKFTQLYPHSMVVAAVPSDKTRSLLAKLLGVVRRADQVVLVGSPIDGRTARDLAALSDRPSSYGADGAGAAAKDRFRYSFLSRRSISHLLARHFARMHRASKSASSELAVEAARRAMEVDLGALLRVGVTSVVELPSLAALHESLMIMDPSFRLSRLMTPYITMGRRIAGASALGKVARDRPPTGVGTPPGQRALDAVQAMVPGSNEDAHLLGAFLWSGFVHAACGGGGGGGGSATCGVRLVGTLPPMVRPEEADVEADKAAGETELGTDDEVKEGEGGGGGGGGGGDDGDDGDDGYDSRWRRRLLGARAGAGAGALSDASAHTMLLRVDRVDSTVGQVRPWDSPPGVSLGTLLTLGLETETRAQLFKMYLTLPFAKMAKDGQAAGAAVLPSAVRLMAGRAGQEGEKGGKRLECKMGQRFYLSSVGGSTDGAIKATLMAEMARETPFVNDEFSFIEYDSGDGAVSVAVARQYPKATVVSIDGDEADTKSHMERLKRLNEEEGSGGQGSFRPGWGVAGNNAVCHRQVDQQLLGLLHESPEFIRFQLFGRDVLMDLIPDHGRDNVGAMLGRAFASGMTTFIRLPPAMAISLALTTFFGPIDEWIHAGAGSTSGAGSAGSAGSAPRPYPMSGARAGSSMNRWLSDESHFRLQEHPHKLLVQYEVRLLHSLVDAPGRIKLSVRPLPVLAATTGEAQLVRIDVLNMTRNVHHHFDWQRDGHTREYRLHVGINATAEAENVAYLAAKKQWLQLSSTQRGAPPEHPILAEGNHHNRGKITFVYLTRKHDQFHIPYTELYGMTLITVMRLGLVDSLAAAGYHKYVVGREGGREGGG